jgi:cytochrome c oxidase cbb3-type subunit 3
MADKHIDEISGVETTGHEWDGIRELNNPMPRWWVLTFYATILWAIGYMVVYPSIPLLTESTKGWLGQTNRQDLANEVLAAAAGQKVYLDKIAAMPVKDIAQDKALAEFAINGGAAAFKINCAPCHGSGAEGGPGFPNLNDNDWLWGGDIDAIYTTLTHGIRADDPETRTSEMPAFGEMLKPEEMKQVAAYVVSLTGTPGDAAMVAPGKQLFTDNCVACHGEKAEGNRELGAPNLADAIWLRGEGEDAILRQMMAPKHGMMPAWTARLGDVTVKQLAVYVHALGGGE